MTPETHSQKNSNRDTFEINLNISRLDSQYPNWRTIDPSIVILALKSKNITTNIATTIVELQSVDGVGGLSSLGIIHERLEKLGLNINKAICAYLKKFYNTTDKILELSGIQSVNFSYSPHKALEIINDSNTLSIITFFTNPIFNILPTKSKNLQYKFGRSITIPGYTQYLTVQKNQSDVVEVRSEDNLTLHIPRYIVEKFNPPSTNERLETLKETIRIRADNVVDAITVGATMLHQFGGLHPVLIRGNVRTLLRPFSDVAIDPKEKGYQHFRSTDNKYFEPFSAIKKAGFKWIDLEDPAQILIINQFLPGQPTNTPYVGVGGGLQYLEHHRIMAAHDLEMPIVVNISTMPTFN